MDTTTKHASVTEAGQYARHQILEAIEDLGALACLVREASTFTDPEAVKCCFADASEVAENIRESMANLTAFLTFADS